jgi:hypothetical protein
MPGTGNALPDQPDDAALAATHELTAQLSVLRGTVRRDRRATSLPLLVLGGTAAAVMVPAILQPTSMWTGGRLGAALQSMAVVAAFAAIWLAERHRAVTGGVGTGRGFGLATVIGFVLLVVPGGLVLSVIAGPFLTFAIGLLIAGLKQRNAFITWFAVAVGVVGIVNDQHWISNRLPGPHPWVEPAISLALALLTVAAGLLWWRRENRAA